MSCKMARNLRLSRCGDASEERSYCDADTSREAHSAVSEYSCRYLNHTNYSLPGENPTYSPDKTFQVLPRLELGSLDSKSRVLTITP